MGAENRIEDMSEEGNRLLGKAFQGCVRDTVRARSLAYLKPLMASSTDVRVRRQGSRIKT